MRNLTPSQVLRGIVSDLYFSSAGNIADPPTDRAPAHYRRKTKHIVARIAANVQLLLFIDFRDLAKHLTFALLFCFDIGVPRKFPEIKFRSRGIKLSCFGRGDSRNNTDYRRAQPQPAVSTQCLGVFINTNVAAVDKVLGGRREQKRYWASSTNGGKVPRTRQGTNSENREENR